MALLQLRLSSPACLLSILCPSFPTASLSPGRLSLGLLTLTQGGPHV